MRSSESQRFSHGFRGTRLLDSLKLKRKQNEVKFGDNPHVNQQLLGVSTIAAKYVTLY